jgi:hypothetical protein
MISERNLPPWPVIKLSLIVKFYNEWRISIKRAQSDKVFESLLLGVVKGFCVLDMASSSDETEK